MEEFGTTYFLFNHKNKFLKVVKNYGFEVQKSSKKRGPIVIKVKYSGISLGELHSEDRLIMRKEVSNLTVNPILELDRSKLENLSKEF